MSFSVIPESPEVSSVLASIDGQYKVVRGYEDSYLSYYPDRSPDRNTLHTLDPYHGYWIKMNTDATLHLTGQPLATDTPLVLSEGWNLVSYLPDAPLSVGTALYSIDGQYTTVLSYDQGAISYYPSLPPEMNTLTTLQPGHGYWIKMSQEGMLTYPSV